MKLFGYDATDGDERTRPRTLREATIVAGADDLRAIADFLVQCATLMDQHSGRFGHEHLSDHLRGRCFDADLIVVAPAGAAPR